MKSVGRGRGGGGGYTLNAPHVFHHQDGIDAFLSSMHPAAQLQSIRNVLQLGDNMSLLSNGVMTDASKKHILS